MIAPGVRHREGESAEQNDRSECDLCGEASLHAGASVCHRRRSVTDYQDRVNSQLKNRIADVHRAVTYREGEIDNPGPREVTGSLLRLQAQSGNAPATRNLELPQQLLKSD